MTRTEATRKARAYIKKNHIDSFTVIEQFGDFEVVHTEYLDDFTETGWNIIKTYKFNYNNY